MRKLWMLPLLLWAVVSCSKSSDNDDPGNNDQKITCKITSPAEGDVFDIALEDSISIKGEATASVGKISKVTLKVGDQVISEVTSVPFDYNYKFVDGQKTGDLKIELTVEGDKKGSATTSVTVKLTESKQNLTCEISEPADGAEIDLAAASKMTIKGDAEVNPGKISKVTLTVGGNAVAEVTAVPFTYDYTFAADQATGVLEIVLAVEGDMEATVADTVHVTLKRTPAPEPDKLVDARDGHEYKIVTIGDQTWMAENLAYLPKVNKPSESAKTDKGQPFYYVFNYDGNDVAAAKQTNEYKKGGVLYNWFAAMNGAEAGSRDAVPSGVQGICPDGWHLPSAKEWENLGTYVASQLETVQGNGWTDDFGDTHFDDCKNVWSALCAAEGWDISSDSGNPDLANGPRDTFGFGAFPVGDYMPTGFYATRAHAWFWMTSYEKSSYGDYGGYVNLTNISYDLQISGAGKGSQPERGHSVRCLKD